MNNRYSFHRQSHPFLVIVEKREFLAIYALPFAMKFVQLKHKLFGLLLTHLMIRNGVCFIDVAFGYMTKRECIDDKYWNFLTVFDVKVV